MAIDTTPLGIRKPDQNEPFDPVKYIRYVADDADGLIAQVPAEASGSSTASQTIAFGGVATTAELVTVGLPADAGLSVTAVARFTKTTLSTSTVAWGASRVEASIDGGSWADVTEMPGGAAASVYGGSASMIALGYVAPAGVARTVGLRLRVSNPDAGSSAGRESLRLDQASVRARAVRRVTSL